MKPAASPPERATPRATIHDLGYKRYVGSRRLQGTRWRVIVTNLLATSWRGFFRMKAWVLCAFVTTVVFGILTYLWKDKLEPIAAASGLGATWFDMTLPYSYRFYTWFAFILGISLAAQVVARDLGAGAFEFYFSRPVRPVDYVAGKLGGMVLIMGTTLVAGPLLLVLLRVGLSEPSAMLGQLLFVPKVLAVGGLAALAYASVPMAMSTLSRRPRNTIALWVGYWVLIGPLCQALAIGLRLPSLGALNLNGAVVGLALGVLDIRMQLDTLPPPPLWASALSLAGFSLGAIAVIYLRVARAERAGLGGG